MDYLAEFQWLQDNPAFAERPASMDEFLGPEYLDIAKGVRPGVRQALVDIFGEDANPSRIANVQYAMVTGAIGIGKTTFAGIALPYMVHWVLCLKDPQDFFGLLPGSRIAFMQMSTSEDQAREVIFGDIFARIKHSPWFVQNAPHDPKYTKQIRFPGKDIWILPGDSRETTFEGYNILGGILDEMDSHKVTAEKDYADDGYNTIDNRITSRFNRRGLLICIGQMKKANGFAARKYTEYLGMPDKAHVTRMSIWESRGWDYEDPDDGLIFSNPDGTHKSFWYDIKRKKIVPNLVAGLVDGPGEKGIIEIPEYYRREFENSPEKALKDLVGVPPATSDPFISLVDRVDDAREAWVFRNGHPEGPVGPSPLRPRFADWFRGDGDPRKRVMHIDMAYSGNGDALGMAMGHIVEMREIDNELKPVISIDFVARIKAEPGTEIILSDVRRIIYELHDDMHFNLKTVTFDGFNNTEMVQQLRKKRFGVDVISMDKSKLPYEDLRDAIYDRRIEIPPFLTVMADGRELDILYKELSELTDTGKKIDHPAAGSKDVADALAGVVSTLMGDRSYRRGVPNPSRVDNGGSSGHTTDYSDLGMSRRNESAWPGGFGTSAPMPPMTSLPSIQVPDHLRRR